MSWKVVASVQTAMANYIAVDGMDLPHYADGDPGDFDKRDAATIAMEMEDRYGLETVKVDSVAEIITLRQVHMDRMVEIDGHVHILALPIQCPFNSRPHCPCMTDCPLARKMPAVATVDCKSDVEFPAKCPLREYTDEKMTTITVE